MHGRAPALQANKQTNTKANYVCQVQYPTGEGCRVGGCGGVDWHVLNSPFLSHQQRDHLSPLHCLKDALLTPQGVQEADHVHDKENTEEDFTNPLKNINGAFHCHLRTFLLFVFFWLFGCCCCYVLLLCYLSMCIGELVYRCVWREKDEKRGET